MKDSESNPKHTLYNLHYVIDYTSTWEVMLETDKIKEKVISKWRKHRMNSKCCVKLGIMSTLFNWLSTDPWKRVFLVNEPYEI